MKRLIGTIFVAMCLAAGVSAYAHDNIAYRGTDVRFTVVSPSAFRMEYSPKGSFTDNPTYACIGRDFPKTDFSVAVENDTLKISTSELRLQYRIGSGAFCATNLEIAFLDGTITWNPSIVAEQNLGGTELSLDGVKDGKYMYDANGHPKGSSVEFREGLLNRDGWTLYDDSNGPILTNDGWIQPRENDGGQDWWFVSYGNDYKKGLDVFNKIMGQAPMLPRYAFGAWWSRYWLYTQGELEEMVDSFEDYNLPLDVLGVDMDWHFHRNTDRSWYSWTVNPNIFPDLKGCLSRIKEKGIVTNPNIHPLRVTPEDSLYTAMATALGRTDGKEIRGDLFDKSFDTAFNEILLKDLRDKGFDFWWWDNGTRNAPKQYGGISFNSWQSKCLVDEMLSNGDGRPVLLCRYAGFGSHRYIGVGFSGDTFSSWGTLETVVKMSSSACNSLFGSWSHDMAGFQECKGCGLDSELYVRWAQFSACSPFFRWQSAKQKSMDKYPWLQPAKYGKAIREAIRMHYMLAPHIYTLAREMHDTGIGFTRPLYYTSKEEGAYCNPCEYTLGDDVLFRAITAPADSSGLTEVDVWLPEGKWYEWSSGSVLDGGSYRRSFALDEFPMYLRAGSILPMYDGTQKNLKGNDEDIVLAVAPGDGEFSYELYEDAGDGLDYSTAFARTTISNSRSGDRQTIRIAPRKGKYEGMPKSRRFIVKVLNAACPKEVSINGKKVSGWKYDGREVALVIDLGKVRCSKGATVEIEYLQAPAGLDGLKGKAKRYREAEPNLWFPSEEFLRRRTVSERLSAHPERLYQEVEEFSK